MEGHLLYFEKLENYSRVLYKAFEVFGREALWIGQNYCTSRNVASSQGLTQKPAVTISLTTPTNDLHQSLIGYFCTFQFLLIPCHKRYLFILNTDTQSLQRSTSFKPASWRKLRLWSWREIWSGSVSPLEGGKLCYWAILETRQIP